MGNAHARGSGGYAQHPAPPGIPPSHPRNRWTLVDKMTARSPSRRTNQFVLSHTNTRAYTHAHVHGQTHGHGGHGGHGGHDSDASSDPDNHSDDDDLFDGASELSDSLSGDSDTMPLELDAARDAAVQDIWAAWKADGHDDVDDLVRRLEHYGVGGTPSASAAGGSVADAGAGGAGGGGRGIGGGGKVAAQLPWTAEEDALLLKAALRHPKKHFAGLGRRWAAITNIVNEKTKLKAVRVLRGRGAGVLWVCCVGVLLWVLCGAALLCVACGRVASGKWQWPWHIVRGEQQ